MLNAQDVVERDGHFYQPDGVLALVKVNARKSGCPTCNVYTCCDFFAPPSCRFDVGRRHQVNGSVSRLETSSTNSGNDIFTVSVERTMKHKNRDIVRVYLPSWPEHSGVRLS